VLLRTQFWIGVPSFFICLSRRYRMKSIWSFALFIALGAGCAATKQPSPNHDHPASVNAPASAMPEASTTLSNHEPVASPAPAHEMGNMTMDHGSMQPKAAPATTTAAAMYVCPMHPEVTSSAPGKCPKCGMTLVKKEQGGHDGGH
jgi:uncharacterized protein involved in copper resistance